MQISEEVHQLLLNFQQNELNEYKIYKNLATWVKPDSNKKILEQIAKDELRHYQSWKKYTGVELKPNRWQVWLYSTVARLFGFTFGVKLMERGEESAAKNYSALEAHIPEAHTFAEEEDAHEQVLIGMLDEELLRYAGSVVLGLNDALVELTGALAGLTLALQDTSLVALSGSITGIAAAFSMAASEYLSVKSEKTTTKTPVKSAAYTGIAYIITVLALIFPYLVFSNLYVCLGITLAIAIVIIAAFNYYISVAKDEDFKSRFGEMALLSLSVAVLSFGVGYVLRQVFGIEV
jgi:VIT1/CCC1 family predicted Fe2+/Mn2+ transporter